MIQIRWPLYDLVSKPPLKIIKLLSKGKAFALSNFRTVFTGGRGTSSLDRVSLVCSAFFHTNCSEEQMFLF